MRTTELKINNEKKEAVLIAGGQGFKIYTTSDTDGWILSLKRKIFIIEEHHPEFMLIACYVNLKYQPLNEQEKIKTEFSAFIASKAQMPRTTALEANP